MYYLFIAEYPNIFEYSDKETQPHSLNIKNSLQTKQYDAPN